MRHSLGEDGDFDGAFGFVLVTFDTAGFVKAGEGLGEVEEVACDEVGSFFADSLL